ncbi:hypothetical protein ABCS02_24090 [Microbacterium sp. X-17]|uniref:hypothetical protein n=1 Tax=Microbacterium sp. X-17 TaxID=3144404 RepID=UPI0031F4BBC0
MTADPGATTDPALALRRRKLGRESWGFAIGSVCFFIGALPWYVAMTSAVFANATFAIGAVFFTLAAGIQLALTGRRFPYRGMTPADVLDWWSAAVQFVGTLFFNLSTIQALSWAIRDPDTVGAGWRPDAWGSICFLVSSGLALGAVSRRHELWDIRARTPLATWLNMAGSVLFGISAIGAYVIPGSDEIVSLFWTNLGTALGALGFFLAAVITRPGATRGGAPRSPERSSGRRASSSDGSGAPHHPA